MEIKDSFGRKPVKEKINVDAKKDMPLYMRESAYNNVKEVVSSEFKGGDPVQNNDRVWKNKSDYTQRGDK